MRLLFLTIFILFSTATQAATLGAGNKSVGITFSSNSVGAENYTIAGASINYFVIDNLSIGAGYEYWFSGSPSVSKSTLESTYYIQATDNISPYFGLLYSHYFIEDNADIDSYGYRAGISYINAPLLFSVGLRQEKFTSDRTIFSNDETTGEFVIGFAF